MPLNKPRRGDLDWDIALNNALEYLDSKTTVEGLINIDGGSASSVYTSNQSIDGGTAGSF
jgi:hypothetical protein